MSIHIVIRRLRWSWMNHVDSKGRRHWQLTTPIGAIWNGRSLRRIFRDIGRD